MSFRTLAVAGAFIAATSLLSVAQAQAVDPYKPLVTAPPGPQNPAFNNPSAPGIQGHMTSGVIAPPANQMSNMPVIRPTTPSNMPVIAPPGSPGGNPSVVPK
jgi:hypothetical protein